MKHTQQVVVSLALLFTAWPAASENQACNDEYERGRREMGAYAEMAGIVEGVIYGYSLGMGRPEVCLPAEAKSRVKAIANALISESFANDPILMDEVPSRQESHQFLKRFFSCNAGR